MRDQWLQCGGAVVRQGWTNCPVGPTAIVDSRRPGDRFRRIGAICRRGSNWRFRPILSVALGKRSFGSCRPLALSDAACYHIG